MDRPKWYKSTLLEEDARYRQALRGSTNRHVQAESKMLDAQAEAEEKVLRSRRARSPRGNVMAPTRMAQADAIARRR